MNQNTPLPLRQRCRRFLLLLAVALGTVYGILPLVTRQVPILAQMAGHLEENGIDPSRYYYTDVEQVAEAEAYLAEVLSEK